MRKIGFTANSTKFKLAFSNHPNRELQKEWKDFGAESFTIEILENLEYDKDGIKTDYTENLILLEMIWKEKLLKQKVDFYKK